MQKKQSPSAQTDQQSPTPQNSQKPEVLEEVVIEELSIDGICGVY